MTVLNDADELFLGNRLVDEVYLGAEKVWPPPPLNILVADGQGGDWLARGWGTSGYVISDAPVIKALPPGVSFASSGTQHTWVANYNHSSAMKRPDGSGLQACWYAGSSQDLTLTFTSAWYGRIRAYCLSVQPDNREQHMTLLVNGMVMSTFAMSATDPSSWYGTGEAIPAMMPGGRWIGWNVDAQPGDVIILRAGHVSGGNSVVSGLLLDKL
jgi:hypothetical protein